MSSVRRLPLFIAVCVCLAADPACTSAFSVLEGAIFDDDEKCRTECAAKANGDCADASNVWLCVADNLTACYIPNKNNVACHIERPGAEDSLNGTCHCSASSSGPCTSLEAMATEYVWKPTVSEFLGEGKGVIIAKNNRAYMASSEELWHYEAGPQVSGCELQDWIKGVFCQGKYSSKSATG